MKRNQKQRLRRIRFEALERRQLLAADIEHNFVEAEDVNLDGSTSAVDALNVINAVQRRHSGQTQGVLEILADVNSDGAITARDALQVINRLARPEDSIAELESGVDELAQSILLEELPGGITPQTADRWLSNLEERTEVESNRTGPFNRFDKDLDGQITEDEVRDAIWERLVVTDADDSGSVSQNEIMAARPSEDKLERPQSDSISAFTRIDANQDGFVFEEEVSERAWERLSTADANEDGGVTLDEIQAARAEREDGVQRPNPGDRFASLDLNEDGQLTEDEVSEDAWARISQADANEDGGVTLDEIQAARAEREDGVQRPNPGDRFASLDLNEDGQLTEDEVSEDAWARISQADANEDGGVTLDEIQAARAEREDGVQRPNPGDRFASLDLNEDGQLTEDEVSEDAWARISQADANEDGGVTLDEIQAARTEREDGVQRPKPGDRFASLDLNEDGQLTEDEVSEDAWARISQADANEDGGVTLDEIQAARAEREDGVQRPNPGDRFASLDLNEDGQLTEDEVSEDAWARISQADANEDGGVTLDEIQAARAEREDGVQRPEPGSFFAKLDINEDGLLTEDEVSSQLWERISGADSNADGGISLNELLSRRTRLVLALKGDDAPAALAAFHKLDRNDDGTLRRAELSPQEWEMLRSADRNENRQLTFVEIRQHFRG